MKVYIIDNPEYDEKIAALDLNLACDLIMDAIDSIDRYNWHCVEGVKREIEEAEADGESKVKFSVIDNGEVEFVQVEIVTVWERAIVW